MNTSETWLQSAVNCYIRGEKQGALALLDEWIQAEPNHALAHCKRGILCKELHRYHEAVDSFNRVVQLESKPQEVFCDAIYHRGDILQYHELFDLAKNDFSILINLEPDSLRGYEGMAGVQSALGLLPQALATANHALSIHPLDHGVQALRYNLMLDLREHDALLHETEQHLAAQPQSAQAYTQYGKLLTHLRRFDAARAAFDQALQLDEQSVLAKQELAGLLHLQGRWHEAYQLRAATSLAAHPNFLQSFGRPVWTGAQNVQSKTVLIHAELGQGDTVQLCRFASLVAQERGATVILKVQKSLVRLLSTLPNIASVLAYEDANPPFDFICSTLALPAIFNVQPHAIAWGEQAYIEAAPAWQAVHVLPIKTKPRVGIVWSGGHAHYNYRRSIPFEKILPILNLQHLEFYSFQKDRARQDLSAHPYTGVIDLADQLGDFADTAALLSQMDLLISVDTSIAHVAGALALPVWMLVRRDHWWLEGRDDNPWYASMRMYTQKDFGNWDEVMARVQQDLQKLLSSP